MVAQTLFTLTVTALVAATFASSPAARAGVLKSHEDCTRAPKNCAPGLVCAGTDTKKRCVSPMAPGKRCQTDPYWVCQAGLECQKKLCKIPRGANCARSPTNCVAGSVCQGTGNRRTCAAPVAPLGARCGRAARNQPQIKCAANLLCDDNICKLPRGAVCTRTRNQCAEGLSCDGKRAEKRCITYKAPGMRCPARENFWICAKGLVCQSSVCKIPVGAACAASPTHCATGTACLGNGAARRCAVPLAKVGEKCNARVKCEAGLACQGRVCKIPAGRACAASPRSCVTGTSCIGSGRARRCGVEPAAAGERCSNQKKCGNGLVCDQVCKFTVNARCERAPKLCSSGTKCVGSGARKTCRRAGAAGDRCTETGSALCASGLVCHSSRCARGVVGEVGNCRHKACKASLVCAGLSKRKICVKPMHKGQKCDVDPYWKCAVGLKCRNNKCADL